MNVMYYGMVNGYHGYYPPSALPTATAGLLGSGATATGQTVGLATAGAPLANPAVASSLMPKWIMPNFSATQIQYMFRHSRMDKGAKVNRAVKCETCGITLNSEQQAQQHYTGKNHLKKLRGIGKKKDGKDGEDSDKETDRRRSRKRKRELGEDDDCDVDDNSANKTDHDDDNAENKTNNDENSTPPDADTDQSSAHDIEKNNNLSSGKGFDLERVKLSPNVENLENSKCENLSQNQSQTDSLDDVCVNVVNVSTDSCKLEQDDALGQSGVKSTDNLLLERSQSDLSLSHNGLPSLSRSSSAPSHNVTESNETESFKSGEGAESESITISSHITQVSISPESLSSSQNKPSPRNNSPKSAPSPSNMNTSLKRTHSPLRGSTSFFHSHSNQMTSTSNSIPYKKTRSSFMAGSTVAVGNGLDLNSQFMSAQHIGMASNGIHGYPGLPAGLRRLPTDGLNGTNQAMAAVLRPLMRMPCATTLPSQVPTYSTPYSSLPTYQPAQGSYPVVSQSSYPFQYQTLLGSDLTGLQMQPRSVLSPFYTAGMPAQNHLQINQSDQLTSSNDLLNCDLSYLTPSKELLAQQMSLKYGTIPTSTGLPAGFQYQAISIQALNSNPAYQNAAVAPFTSTPSPPYRSISGPLNGATAPQLSGVVSNSHNDTQMTLSVSSSEPKLDPVSQAVYDNVLGKLPLKRKREIPCTTCGIIFNSDAQATAHFAGSKHQRKQKNSDGTEATKSEPMDITPPGTEISSDPNKTSSPERIACKLCACSFSNTQQAEIHYSGAKHRKRAQLAQVCTEGLPEGVTSKKWGAAFNCEICQVTLNSLEQLKAHKNGKQHQLKEGTTAGSTQNSPVGTVWDEVSGHTSGWVYCPTCNVSITPGFFNKHEMSDNHKKNKAKQIPKISQNFLSSGLM